MNTPNPETSGMQLPPPVMDSQPVMNPNVAPGAQGRPNPNSIPGGPEVGRNMGAQAPSGGGAAQGAQPLVPLPAVPQYRQAVPGAGAPAGTPVNLSLAADPTNDLIEKEWVSKAKQIVEQTRDDPYKQSEGLTMMKVDYMKKRYNKTIKYK